MTENHENKGFGSVAASRRAFIKRFAAGAFVAPVIASFALDGMASAAVPDHGFPNQGFPNQGFPDHGFPGNDPGRLRELEREIERELECRLHHGHGCSCFLRPSQP